MLNVDSNRANGEKSCWRRKTSLEKKLIVGIVIVSIIALALLIGLIIKRKSKSNECTTKDCVEASAQLLTYVDPEADPCNDFFDFVCGSFVKNAVKESRTSPFTTADAKFKNEMKSIVVDPIQKIDSKSNVVLKQYYQACMNEEKIDSDNNTAFSTELEKLGGWPIVKGNHWNKQSTDWVRITLDLTNLGLPFDSFFRIGMHTTDNDTIIPKIERFQRNLISQNMKAKYISFIHGVAMTLGAPPSSFKEVTEIVDFIGNLSTFPDASDTDKQTPLKELEKDCPQIPWLPLLSGLTGMNMTREHLVAHNLEDYCTFLHELLQKTSNRIQIDYLIWTAVEKMSDYLSASIRFLADTFKLPKAIDRFELCFADTNKRFTWVKETIYIRRKTDGKIRIEIKEMTKNIIAEFIPLIKENDWMDERAKKFALLKAQKIEIVVGCDDDLYDEENFDQVLGVDNLNFTTENIVTMIQERRIKGMRHLTSLFYKSKPLPWDQFFTRAVELNAFFAPDVNAMVIPAPIVQDVFFNIDFPHFMNYGSLGRIIGHEIMHGFEKPARNSSGIEGEDTYTDWWSPQTEAAYDKKVQCAIDQYEKFPFTKYKLNGTQTLDENVSDFVGIDAAYKAYLKWVKKNGEEKSLAGLSYSPRQMFWMQANIFLCFKKLVDDSTDYEEPDEHSIPSFRIVAGLKNSKYFANDYNCPVGSPMNPKDKCRIM